MNRTAGRVVAVVVTHRRPGLLARGLAALAAQDRRPDHLVVVDNADDPHTRDVVEGCDLPLTYLPSATNLGGAGGFAYGLLTARALGADWVWMADDDGRPATTGTLTALLAAADRESLEVVAPLVLDVDDPSRLAFGLRSGTRRATVRTDLPATGVLRDVVNPFNGMLLAARALDAVGVPDPRLVVRGDEVEIHRRLVRSGLPFGTCLDASWLHPSGARDVVPLLGGTLPVYVPADPARAEVAYRNLGWLTSQPGMRWRRWPDEARYAWYHLVLRRDPGWWRVWRERSAAGRREHFVS
ncbi:galactofuranosyltransferase GlfT1 [Phycicoccus avicenniae]|uniref:galactofuranosyltransferase GlfT1 n=1 Tax=Phycicoccus avicenniae TaxID=2828860 RepID=UPI003D2BEA94